MSLVLLVDKTRCEIICLLCESCLLEEMACIPEGCVCFTFVLIVPYRSVEQASLWFCVAFVFAFAHSALFELFFYFLSRAIYLAFSFHCLGFFFLPVYSATNIVHLSLKYTNTHSLFKF